MISDFGISIADSDLEKGGSYLNRDSRDFIDS
jgi:hypothetical protein